MGRKTAKLVVRHTGDRPVQVGSHYHFYEVNDALAFERETARGMRLNIPAGTSVRFEPGEEKEVPLVELAGERLVLGHKGTRKPMSLSIPRRTYADLYGPTTGDRVRLADTELIIEVEKDFAVYGDEITFGGGKVIRDGMGQSARARRARTGASGSGDHQRADHRSLGHRQGRHRHSRRAHREGGQSRKSGHHAGRRSANWWWARPPK